MSEFHLFEEKKEQSLLFAFAWWEKRRWIFNVIVGVTGILSLLLLSLLPLLNFFDLAGIILYGIIANLFYSLGFLIEAGARYYLKSQKDFTETRKQLFGLGLVISILVTIGLTFLFSIILLATATN